MTTITAKVIKHSSHMDCPDIITMELTYNRFIHAEFMTHREFSRNASSSRAIPVHKQLRMILDDPAAPEVWGTNKPGMQAGDELTGLRLWAAKALWGTACHTNVLFARAMNALGVHKQIVNRICEPYAHIKVLVTSTNWSNFLALRDHPDAQPEIAILARAVRVALESSIPTPLEVGEWHLPYITPQERHHSTDDNFLLKCSVARCARLSYSGFDGTINANKDIELYDKLVGGDPKHASPAEHQATPLFGISVNVSGNLRHWGQYRKTLDNEAQLDPEHWKV